MQIKSRQNLADSEEISCIYCNSTEASLLFAKNMFKVVQCNNCGLQYVANPPQEKEVSNIYTEKYFTGDLSRFGYIDYLEEEEYNRINQDKIIKNIEKYVSGGKILDVGCASGGFLKLFSKNWDKYGNDVSSFICKHAKELQDCKIIEGEFNNLSFPDESFDVISFLDSLDHMKNPIASLEKAFQLLKKGGLIVITCGDADSIFAKIMDKRWYLYIPPTHLFFFSRNILDRMLNNLGFEILKVEYSGKWVFLKLCLFRLSYIFPGVFFKYIYSLFRDNVLGNFKLYYNFKDVMTVYARKK